MATDHSNSSASERLTLKGGELFRAGLWCIGLIGILVALFTGCYARTDHNPKRFLFAYLVSFAYVLSLSLGGLFFTILQHLTKAAWSVNVRRIAEWLAASMPIVGILSLPILLTVLAGRTDVYPWAAGLDPAPQATAVVAPAPGPTVSADKAADSEKGEPEEITPFKRIYLSPLFWCARVILYFAIWSGLGIWYWRKSLKQDATGDIGLTTRMQACSPVAMLLFAVTLTGGAFDLLMALDTTWASTIFGVYFFAGCVVSVMAFIILTSLFLQRAGYLRESITTEHYHDLGKFLFGFTFFWGYIAFSQYMLMWYANLPEETEWYRRHGATTDTALPHIDHRWTCVIVAILLGNLLLPFGGLMSRYIKRNPVTLAFWALWLLAFHWLDVYWVIMPQLDGIFHFGVTEVAAFVGLLSLFLAYVASRATAGALRPTRDPRLEASLEFQNV